jgi:hypothetical protein
MHRETTAIRYPDRRLFFYRGLDFAEQPPRTEPDNQ